MFLFCSDRVCYHLDNIVPLDSTKAYDMRDVIYAVSLCIEVQLGDR